MFAQLGWPIWQARVMKRRILGRKGKALQINVVQARFRKAGSYRGPCPFVPHCTGRNFASEEDFRAGDMAVLDRFGAWLLTARSQTETLCQATVKFSDDAQRNILPIYSCGVCTFGMSRVVKGKGIPEEHTYVTVSHFECVSDHIFGHSCGTVSLSQHVSGPRRKTIGVLRLIDTVSKNGNVIARGHLVFCREIHLRWGKGGKRTDRRRKSHATFDFSKSG